MGLILYASIGFYVLKVENDYRREFELPIRTLRQIKWSLILGVVGMTIYHCMSNARIPITAAPFLWVAAASLVGVWRVDRVLLLIPDRYQLIGLLSGICYVLAMIQSGEEATDLLTEVGFALLLVGLLWLLSIAYEKLRGTVGFGFGDTKLLAWLALFVGKRMPNLIVIAVLIGILTMVAHVLKQGIKEKKWALPRGQDAFAFGPAIVVASFLEGLLFYG